jgi:hypothetical protein
VFELYPITNGSQLKVGPKKCDALRQPAIGGGGGIRTHGAVSRTTVFKTVALNHSATPPEWPRHAQNRMKMQGKRARLDFVFEAPQCFNSTSSIIC